MHWMVGRMHAPRVLIADSDPHLRQLVFTALLAVDVFSDCATATGWVIAWPARVPPQP